jgi:hypothetical protein
LSAPLAFIDTHCAPLTQRAALAHAAKLFGEQTLARLPRDAWVITRKVIAAGWEPATGRVVNAGLLDAWIGSGPCASRSEALVVHA